MTRGWFCTCSTEPSAKTEPSCNTVTFAPRLRTKAMSCSTTTIVRSRARSRISAAAEEHLARIRPGFAGDDIHHRRLAGAVRTDDRAQFAFLDNKRQIVQCLEPVEADRDAVEIQQDVAGRMRDRGRLHMRFSAAIGASIGNGAPERRRGQGNCRKTPTMPRGKTSVVSTNSPPRKNSQISGAAVVSQVFARLTSTAPIAAPTSVPRPPTETQIATSIELPGENSLGLMMPTCGT